MLKNSGKIYSSFVARLSTLITFSFLLILLLIVPGCGGGTRGTGDTQIRGKVLDTDDSPLTELLVTLLETGDSTVTDQSGEFLLESDLQDAEAFTLEFNDTKGLQTSASISNPQQAQNLFLDVRINPKTGETNVRVTTPTPSPVPVRNTPEPTQAPLLTPTPAPSPSSPEATPTPIPTPIPSHTTAPTVTPTARACRADFNHDGVVNQDDYNQFSAAFTMGDISSDFNNDGFVTGDDFDEFNSAYNAGC